MPVFFLPWIATLTSLLSSPIYYAYLTVGFIVRSSVRVKLIFLIPTIMATSFLLQLAHLRNQRKQRETVREQTKLFNFCTKKVNEKETKCKEATEKCIVDGFDSSTFCRLWSRKNAKEIEEKK